MDSVVWALITLFSSVYCSTFYLVEFSSRYASLYFCCAIEQNDNELLTLEVIHRYVELLDKYFGSVSWTQSISYHMKKEFILNGQNCDRFNYIVIDSFCLFVLNRCASSILFSTLKKRISYWMNCWLAAKCKRHRKRMCWKRLPHKMFSKRSVHPMIRMTYKKRKKKQNSKSMTK